MGLKSGARGVRTTNWGQKKRMDSPRMHSAHQTGGMLLDSGRNQLLVLIFPSHRFISEVITLVMFACIELSYPTAWMVMYGREWVAGASGTRPYLSRYHSVKQCLASCDDLAAESSRHC